MNWYKFATRLIRISQVNPPTYLMGLYGYIIEPSGKMHPTHSVAGHHQVSKSLGYSDTYTAIKNGCIRVASPEFLYFSSEYGMGFEFLKSITPEQLASIQNMMGEINKAARSSGYPIKVSIDSDKNYQHDISITQAMGYLRGMVSSHHDTEPTQTNKNQPVMQMDFQQSSSGVVA